MRRDRVIVIIFNLENIYYWLVLYYNYLIMVFVISLFFLYINIDDVKNIENLNFVLILDCKFLDNFMIYLRNFYLIF